MYYSNDIQREYTEPVFLVARHQSCLIKGAFSQERNMPYLCPQAQERERDPSCLFIDYFRMTSVWPSSIWLLTYKLACTVHKNKTCRGGVTAHVTDCWLCTNGALLVYCTVLCMQQLRILIFLCKKHAIHSHLQQYVHFFPNSVF